MSLQHKSLPSKHLSHMRRSLTPKTRPNIATTTAKSHKSGALEADVESAISKSGRSLSSEQSSRMHRQKHLDLMATVASLSSSVVTPDSKNSNFDDDEDTTINADAEDTNFGGFHTKSISSTSSLQYDQSLSNHESMQSYYSLKSQSTETASMSALIFHLPSGGRNAYAAATTLTRDTTSSADTVKSKNTLQSKTSSGGDIAIWTSGNNITSSSDVDWGSNSNFDDVSSLQNTSHADKHDGQRLQFHSKNCQLLLKLDRAMDKERHQYHNLADCLSKNMRRTVKENDELTQGIHNLIHTCDILEKEKYLLEKQTKQGHKTIHMLEDTLTYSESRVIALMEEQQEKNQPSHGQDNQHPLMIATRTDANELKAAKKEAKTCQRKMLALSNDNDVLLEDCEKLMHALRKTRRQRDDFQKKSVQFQNKIENSNLNLNLNANAKTASTQKNTPSSSVTQKQEDVICNKHDDLLHQPLLSFADDSSLSGKGHGSKDGIGGHRFHTHQFRTSSSHGGSEDIDPDTEEARMAMSALSFHDGDKSTQPNTDEESKKEERTTIAKIIKGGTSETTSIKGNSTIIMGVSSCLPGQSTNEEAFVDIAIREATAVVHTEMLELKEQLNYCHVEIACLAQILRKERTVAITTSRQSKQSKRTGRSRSSKASSCCGKLRSISPCAKMKIRQQLHQRQQQYHHPQPPVPPSGRRGQSRARSPHQEATGTRGRDTLSRTFRGTRTATHQPALARPATARTSPSRSCYGVS
jgi:hypothetical protein